MSHNAARRLRPYLFHGFEQAQCTASTRAFTRCSVASQSHAPKETPSSSYEGRLAKLDAYRPRGEWYPRLAASPQTERTPVAKFQQEYDRLGNDETCDDDMRTITGTMLFDVV